MTHRPLSAHDVPFDRTDDERFQRIGEGRYVLSLPDLHTGLAIDYLRRERYALGGELTVHTAIPGVRTTHGVLFQGSVNLSSLRDRETVARTLQERTSKAGFDLAKWRAAVDELSIRTKGAERTGDPAVVLRDVQRRTEERWLHALGFRLPERSAAMILSDGDTLKTYAADAIAVALARHGVNVGILDSTAASSNGIECRATTNAGN